MDLDQKSGHGIVFGPVLQRFDRTFESRSLLTTDATLFTTFWILFSYSDSWTRKNLDLEFGAWILFIRTNVGGWM